MKFDNILDSNTINRNHYFILNIIDFFAVALYHNFTTFALCS